MQVLREPPSSRTKLTRVSTKVMPMNVRVSGSSQAWSQWFTVKCLIQSPASLSKCVSSSSFLF